MGFSRESEQVSLCLGRHCKTFFSRADFPGQLSQQEPGSGTSGVFLTLAMRKSFLSVTSMHVIRDCAFCHTPSHHLCAPEWPDEG